MEKYGFQSNRWIAGRRRQERETAPERRVVDMLTEDLLVPRHATLLRQQREQRYSGVWTGQESWEQVGAVSQSIEENNNGGVVYMQRLYQVFTLPDPAGAYLAVEASRQYSSTPVEEMLDGTLPLQLYYQRAGQYMYVGTLSTQPNADPRDGFTDLAPGVNPEAVKQLITQAKEFEQQAHTANRPQQ
jgi:hypothetical protein